MLTDNERKLALRAFAVDENARRWGNLILEVHDEIVAENERFRATLDEISDYSCYGTPWDAYVDVKRIARAALGDGEQR